MFRKENNGTDAFIGLGGLISILWDVLTWLWNLYSGARYGFPVPCSTEVKPAYEYRVTICKNSGSSLHRTHFQDFIKLFCFKLHHR
ncbi:hypothetical protein SAMN05421820_103666 [Pedobacter steynii]|uniref:Uncharacterized protein n=1 Tax=Pedobacter steynii TaxID=430522 RepID=A0A1G9SPC2_9SPHI|nr:hypothetical protein SAMN05421820_103666 [Pedobacter steynii]